MQQHLENVLGAFVFAVSDRIKKALTETTGCSEGASIALAFIGSRTETTIDDLRYSLDVDTHSAATRVVARLEEQNLITKTKDAKDGRCIQLHLTPDGERLRNKMLAERAKILGKLLDRLDATEREVIQSALKKLLAAMSFDLKGCDRTCRFCDVELCHRGECPVQPA
jgi:Transcriptional regulators